MKLTFSPGSIAVASVVGFFEAGVAFEPVRVDFSKQGQRDPAYLAINPKGRVPALITDHGILTETIAILEFACPNLIPTEPWAAARMREINTYLASTMHVAHAHKMRGSRWADQRSSWDDMRAKVPETMTDCAAYIEDKIAGPLVLGETLCLADPYLFAIASWLGDDGVDVEHFPKLTAFLAAMEARPSVQRARAEGYLG